jgi:hypothetical protein
MLSATASRAYHAAMPGRPAWPAVLLAGILPAGGLLATGCGSGSPAQQHASPSRSASGLATGAQRRALAARYLVIAKAGNRRLEIDFDGMAGRDRHNLRASLADLRDAAATERLFDQRLLEIRFPPVTEAVARTLYRVNQARASLTVRIAGSVSLRQLDALKPRLTAANGPVEQQVRLIRRQLGLPPPNTS